MSLGTARRRHRENAEVRARVVAAEAARKAEWDALKHPAPTATAKADGSGLGTPTDLIMPATPSPARAAPAQDRGRKHHRR